MADKAAEKAKQVAGEAMASAQKTLALATQAGSQQWDEFKSGAMGHQVEGGTLYQEGSRAIFVAFLAPAMVFAALVGKILLYVKPQKDIREGMMVVLLQALWRVVLFVCSGFIVLGGSPNNDAEWAKFSEDHEANNRKAIEDRQPAFVLINHTSFFDTIWSLTNIPMKPAWHLRSYVSSHLFGVPVLAQICKAVGHFPIFFKSQKNGDFGVDKEKMIKVQARVDKHLANDGILGFFPEGTINNTPEQLNPFRYGGFKAALDVDARIWCQVLVGASKVWPKSAPVGGYPATGMYEVRAIAPEGCRKLLASLKESLTEEQKDYPDERILAEHAQATMQAMYDSLAVQVKAAEDKSIEVDAESEDD